MERMGLAGARCISGRGVLAPPRRRADPRQCAPRAAAHGARRGRVARSSTRQLSSPAQRSPYPRRRRHPRTTRYTCPVRRRWACAPTAAEPQGWAHDICNRRERTFHLLLRPPGCVLSRACEGHPSRPRPSDWLRRHDWRRSSARAASALPGDGAPERRAVVERRCDRPPTVLHERGTGEGQAHDEGGTKRRAKLLAHGSLEPLESFRPPRSRVRGPCVLPPVPLEGVTALTAFLALLLAALLVLRVTRRWRRRIARSFTQMIC